MSCPTRSYRRTTIRVPTRHRHPSPPPPKGRVRTWPKHRSDDPHPTFDRDDHACNIPHEIDYSALCSPPALDPHVRDPPRRHHRRKPPMQRPTGSVRRDSGYDSDDAGDASNEESTCYSQERHDYYARMSTPRNSPSRITPFGLLPPGLDTRPSLLRPGSPSNDSSASTDDDTISANVDPYALEYYLGNDVTWRESEILSQSSEEELADDGLARHFHGAQHPASSFHSDMGSYPHPRHSSQRRPHRSSRAPRMPKRVPLVPTCSKSRKRASMRAAWKMRFGRLFESDSEAGTEVEDELDWEGYESADARRIVAMRIHKAGGGDGRKVMQGKEHLTELLFKQPINPKRLAARVARRTRADVTRGCEPEPEPDAAATVQPPVVDTCTTCAHPVLSPLSLESTTESPTSTNSSASLVTPNSTPPSSVPNTPCPTCEQLSPSGGALQLSLCPAQGARSSPCKAAPLDIGMDPLSVFAVELEKEKQRDFTGLLQRPVQPPESILSTMSNGFMRGVKSILVKLNNIVDLAANSPLPTSVEGTCLLCPVMDGVACEIRAVDAKVPAISPAPGHQRRRSYLGSPTSQPGAPTSPYGYRVRPHQVSTAFPSLSNLKDDMGNVASSTVPAPVSDSAPILVELEAVRARPVETDPSPSPASAVSPKSDQVPITPIDLKGPPANNAEVRRRRASRSPSRRRASSKRSAIAASNDKAKVVAERKEALEANQDEISRSRAVFDSKYWRVLAGEMEQRRRGGMEVAFMVRLAVEEGRNLPIFTSDAQQAATGEVVVGGVWKASLARWRVGGVGKGPTRIRSSLVNEVGAYSESSDTASDSDLSSSF